MFSLCDEDSARNKLNLSNHFLSALGGLWQRHTTNFLLECDVNSTVIASMSVLNSVASRDEINEFVFTARRDSTTARFPMFSVDRITSREVQCSRYLCLANVSVTQTKSEFSV